MILIAAALAEELEIALNLCQNRSLLKLPGVRAWRATRSGRNVTLVKTGVGPKRSEASLNLLLKEIRPARILIFGYCGALDPALKVGMIVASQEASLLDDDSSASSSLENLTLAGTWVLAESSALYENGILAGLPFHRGTALTSRHLLGNPKDKLTLYRRFQAATVDMETAGIARAAAPFSIPTACVRAVSDEASDEFLAPFSYTPNATLAARAVRILSAGKWIHRYSQWRERATIARGSLRRFLLWYLDSYTPRKDSIRCKD
jgi:nucleoside phosphorylase